MSLRHLAIRIRIALCATFMVASSVASAQDEVTDSYHDAWSEWNERAQGELELRKTELENAKNAILNAGLYVDVQLKQAYLRAYNQYVRAYTRYVDSLVRKYRQQDALRDALMWSYGRMKGFQRQSLVCNARVKALWRHQVMAGNQDLWDSRIHYSTVGRILRAQASRDHGEECVHKVMLEHEASRRLSMGMADELLSLRFVPESPDADVPALVCPADAPQAIPSADMDPMSVIYPLAAAEIDGEPTAYFVPVTYYQLYQLLSDASSPFKLAPPGGDAPACGVRHESTRRLYSFAHGVEETLAADFVDLQPGVRESGRYVRDYGRNASRNYATVIDTMRTIYEKIDACINVNGGGDTGGGVPEVTHPEMSRSIEACYAIAETYRQQAFDNEEVISQIIRALANAHVDPPYDPLSPILDEPGDG